MKVSNKRSKNDADGQIENGTEMLFKNTASKHYEMHKDGNSI